MAPVNGAIFVCTKVSYNASVKQYSASEAREHWSEILDLVQEGERITITKHGVPVASITRAPNKNKPEFGWAKGLWIADDFDTFLPPGFEKYVK